MRAGLGGGPGHPLGTLQRTHLLSARGPNRAQGLRPMFHRAGGAGLGSHGDQGQERPHFLELYEDRIKVGGRHLAGLC